MAPVNSRLAIDLSSSLIRVLEGAIGGPMRCGSAGLPNGAAGGGRVKEPAAVGLALRQLLARTEIGENRAFVAVSDSLATFRTLRLPSTAQDQEVSAAVARELPLDPTRLATRWVDMGTTSDRDVYAAAWDRALLKNVTDAVKLAGVDPVVVELKSASVARAVTEPSYVIVDLTSEPVEIVLVDRHVPQLWHSFELQAPLSADVTGALGAPLRSVLRFYSRRLDSGFGPQTPIFVCAEQMLPGDVLSRLSDLVEQPVLMLPAPPRVPEHVRHSTYLACIGLIMRRSQ